MTHGREEIRFCTRGLLSLMRGLLQLFLHIFPLRDNRSDREIFFRERGIKQFIESGAVMGMGTDSGTPMNFHTEALWREAKTHVDMGMSPQRVISALTRVGANILGKQRELGTIEPGKLADIIVVNGNPLYDITALSHVETVVKGGKVYKP